MVKLEVSCEEAVKRSAACWHHLRRTNSYCDLVFLVPDRRRLNEVGVDPLISAHSHLLAAFSPLIKKCVDDLRCTCTAQACSAKRPQVEIVLTDTKRSTVHNLLSFVYNGEVEVSDDKERAELIELIKLLGRNEDSIQPPEPKAPSIQTASRASNDSSVASFSATQSTSSRPTSTTTSGLPPRPSQSPCSSTSRFVPPSTAPRSKLTKMSKRQQGSGSKSVPDEDQEMVHCSRCPKTCRPSSFVHHFISHFKDELKKQIESGGNRTRISRLSKCYVCNFKFKLQLSDAKVMKGLVLHDRYFHFVKAHRYGEQFMTPEEKLVILSTSSTDKESVNPKRRSKRRRDTADSFSEEEGRRVSMRQPLLLKVRRSSINLEERRNGEIETTKKKNIHKDTFNDDDGHDEVEYHEEDLDDEVYDGEEYEEDELNELRMSSRDLSMLLCAHSIGQEETNGMTGTPHIQDC